MHKPNHLFPCHRFLLAGFLLLLSGCATAPTSVFLRGLAYEPARSPVQIDASAAIACTATLSPDQLAFFKQQGLNDTTIANMLSARGQTVQHDLTVSGIFTRIVPADSTTADYRVTGHWEDNHVTLTAIQPATGRQVSSNRMEIPAAGPGGFAEVMPALMVALKADLVADLQGQPRPSQRQSVQAEAARQELEQLGQTPLLELLAGSDKSATFARARNRAIITAKNLQLPGMLRESKTTELSALVVKIEQTILDLNHESELAKDHAQQATATGAEPGRIDELRGLAISYRERIELLKPILAALKEEIANRNR